MSGIVRRAGTSSGEPRPAFSGSLTGPRVTIDAMATPEQPQHLEGRVTRVEDAVQEIRFVHMAKTDAQSNGMGILYAGQALREAARA